MNDIKKHEISLIVQILLLMVIVRHGISIVMNLLYLFTLYDTLAPYFNIAMSSVMIYNMILLLQKKALGFYLFVTVQLISVSLHTMIDNDLAFHSLVAALMCGVMFLLLQIRTNGVSAWKVIMSDENKEEDQNKDSDKA